MSSNRWRTVVITSVAPVATIFTDALRQLGHEPVAVLTPRRPQPMLGDLALADATAPRGVDLLFARDRSSLEPLLRAVRPELAVCFGFPWLIPPEVLTVPPLGIINLHPSLLPRHRGPIPTAWAIRAGDPTYGVTWHRMDDAFDTGGILAQAPVPMEPDDTEIRVVGPRLLAVAVELLPRALERVAAGDPGDPQRSTGDEPYAGWFEDEYGTIDWSRPAEEIHRQVRAWGLVGASGRHGARAVVDGRAVFVRRTSLVDPGDADGAVRMDAADGPVWILASEPVDDAPETPGEAAPQP